MTGYRLRQLDIDDKVCEQMDLGLIQEIYPKEVIERCVQESQPWASKARRVRKITACSLVWFVILMGLWSRLCQRLVWQKMVSKLSILHPADGQGDLSASGISGRRAALGSAALQRLLQERCHVLATPEKMPGAFFGRYRLMALDGTLFNLPDTQANYQAFGGSSNQCGKGPYPQARCVLLCECGTHAVVGLDICSYGVSEVDGAHRLLAQVGPNCLVTMDAGITSGGFLEQVRSAGAHALGTLEAGVWEHLPKERRLSDGSILCWVPPRSCRRAKYPLQKGLWVRIITYRITDERLGEPGKVYRLVTTVLNPVTAPALTLIEVYHERWEVELVIDEIKTHQRLQRKVLRSQTPEGVLQELYGIYLAHYVVRALMAHGALEAGVDPDRLSFTEGVFRVTEMIDLCLILEPEATPSLLTCLNKQLTSVLLPARVLRVNRRELKHVHPKFKAKQRHLPPPKPFEPDERFLDFVDVLDPLLAARVAESGT